MSTLLPQMLEQPTGTDDQAALESNVPSANLPAIT